MCLGCRYNWLFVLGLPVELVACVRAACVSGCVSLRCLYKWLPVIWVALVLLLHAPFFQALTVQHAYPGLLPLTLVSLAANVIGFVLIARSGCRRIGERKLRAAGSWPRLRLLLAFAFSLLLNVAMTVPTLA